MKKQLKRMVSMLLVLVILLGMVPAVAAPGNGESFADIKGHWAEQAIETWNQHGVMKGYDGRFRPGDPITRAEVAQVISNLLKLTKQTSNPFADVEGDAWYTEAVLKCAEAGIMVGSGGLFRPNDRISRQESMVVIARSLAIEPVENLPVDRFADGEQVADWAKGAVAALMEAKIVEGTSEGRLAPLKDISRAEVVTILNRSISAYIAKPGTYTLDGNNGTGLVLVASGGVTVSGTVVGTLLIGGGAGQGAVKLKDTEADSVIVSADGVQVKITGKSSITTLKVQEDAEKVTVEMVGNAKVEHIQTPADTQVIRPKPSPQESDKDTDTGSSATGAVSIQGGGDIKDLPEEESAEVRFTTVPENAVLTAASSDTGVVSVMVDGHTVRVTGKKPGTSLVTVTASADGYEDGTAKFSVTVTEKPIPEGAFVLFQGTTVPDIYVEETDYKQVVRAVGDLQLDVERVTEVKPLVRHDRSELSGLAIIVGSVENSQMIGELMAAGKLDEARDLEGKWESYIIKIVDEPMEGVDRALVIAGSDKRGTIYGIYDVSEQIGVSPWYYWGDILPEVKNRVFISEPLKVQGEPSVKYRGIFINDEQSLYAWTKNGNDPVNNIGPETYKKVYELLLRLRANYLWTAMHSEPRLGPVAHFNKYPENRQLAAEYGVVVGTSHCEPMMMNGTADWFDYLQTQGYFEGKTQTEVVGKSNKVDNWMNDNAGKYGFPKYDYSITENRGFIDAYWRQGIDWYKDVPVSYTLGMRGLHDSGFRTANAKTDQEKRDVLQAVVDSQVEMMKDANEESFPIFVPYKEVLPLYNLGLKLPEDTTIVWAEDNQGFIRHFPTAEEQAREGGNGVYYHLQYNGRQGYLWMDSVPPALILSEMSKAYEAGVQQLWVLNVGDIKPYEKGAQFFLDIAWDMEKWTADNLMGQDGGDSFFQELSEKWFPDADSAEVGQILREYYHLNYSRKPEHTTLSDSRGAVYDPVNYGDESMQRLADYQELFGRAAAVLNGLDKTQGDAFYQHVVYPIEASYYNNLKYYYAQKSQLYSSQGRTAAANLYTQLIDWAQTQEDDAKDHYNKRISDGKWDGIMESGNFLHSNIAPAKPKGAAISSVPYLSGLGVVVEGETEQAEDSALDFSAYQHDTRYVDVFNLGGKAFAFTAAADQPWVKLSEAEGTVYDELRLFVTIDWDALPAGDQTATLTIQGGGGTKEIAVRVNNPALAREQLNGYGEANGYVAIEAEHYTDCVKDGDVGFFTFDGLGRSGASVSAGPMGTPNYADNVKSAPYLTYPVYFQTAGDFETTVYRVPSLDEVGQRLAIGVDDGEPVVFSGNHVSDNTAWETNVTNGIERLTRTIHVPDRGYHMVKLYMVDAGVSVDRIVINTGGLRTSNQGPAESYHSVYNRDAGETPKLLSMSGAVLEAYMEEVSAMASQESDPTGKEILENALAQAERALSQSGADAVRRGYAQLAGAVRSVEMLRDIDALLQATLDECGSILAASELPISPYDQASIDRFVPVYDRYKQIDLTTASRGEKLTAYEALQQAILEVKQYRKLKVTASSTESQNGNLAEYVVDGNPDTRWAANGGSYPQWIQVDLGEPYSLTGIGISWFVSGSRAYKYTVETSLDGETYTQVVDRSNNTTAGVVEDALNNVGARYVRVNVSGNSTNSGNASIFEIELQGTRQIPISAETLRELNSALEAAKGLNGGEYTVDSYAPVLAAIRQTEAIVESGVGGEQQAVGLVNTLKNAADMLVRRKNILVDDFQVDTRGELDGWEFIETNGTVTLEGDDNKYLKIAQTEKAASVEARRSFTEISGKVYIEAKVRSDTPKTFYGAPYLYENKDSATILGALALRDDGKIMATYKAGSSSMKQVGTFKSGEWDVISLIVDSGTQKMQVFVNGERIATDLPMRNPLTTLGMLRFYSDDKDTSRPKGIFYLDDLNVYQESFGIVTDDNDVSYVAPVTAEVPLGTALDDAIAALPARVRVKLGDDSWQEMEAVGWTCDAYNAGAAGTYSFTSDLRLPNGITNTYSIQATGKLTVAKIKVACVGDSITEAKRIVTTEGKTEKEQLHGQLQTYLGDNYDVRNFGISGATMLYDGIDKNNAKKGYAFQTQYTQSREFQPDIVVIMLGTNDSKPYNWDTQKTEFIDDTLKLIKSYQDLPSHPKVYLAASPVAGSNSFDIQADVVHEQVVPLQKQAALIADVGFIDTHTAIPAVSTELFFDNVHPKAAGYSILAHAIGDAMAKTDVPKAPSITWTADYTCSTLLGVSPQLPDFVAVSYEGGVAGVAQVEWSLDGVGFDAVGTVNVTGKLKGLEVSTKAVVTVSGEDSPQQKALEAALEEAAGCKADSYTVDSYAVLKKAVKAGEEAATLEAMGAAATQITNAISALVERGTYIVDDRFDDASDLTALENAGWEFIETVGTVTLEEDGGNKYLKLAQTTQEKSKSVEALRSFPETSGKVYVEAKVRSDTAATFYGAPFVFQNRQTYPGTILCAAILQNNKVNVYSTAGSSSQKTVGSFKTATWHTLSMIINGGKIQIYLDGEQLGGDHPMRNTADTIGLLRFYSDDYKNGNGTFYLDDVRVYQEAGTGSEESEDPDKIKIACIGDSITYGNDGTSSGQVDADKTYPAMLQRLLDDAKETTGKTYEVQNFGRNAATMVNNGTRNNGKEAAGYTTGEKPEYQASLAYQPDIVLLMLGTNDCKDENWTKYQADYVPDALSLIKSYQDANPDVQIYVATSATYFKTSNTTTLNRLNDYVVPLQKQIALITDSGYVDVQKATKSATGAQGGTEAPDTQFPDGVHGYGPVTGGVMQCEGYAMIAQAMFEALTKEQRPTAPELVSVAAVACSTTEGQIPGDLPLFVAVEYADGSHGYAMADWSGLTGEQFASAGTVTVNGVLAGLDTKVEATITVTAIDAGAQKALEDALAAAEGCDGEDYTVDSYAALQTAVQTGMDCGPEDMRDCADRITAAIDALVERNYIVNDTFDEAAELADLEGWSFDTCQGDAGTIELAGDAGNQYLKLVQTKQQQTPRLYVEALRSFDSVSTSGKVYVEAKIRSDTTISYYAAPAVFQQEKTEDPICGSILEGGSLKVYKTAGSGTRVEVAKPKTGVWYTVGMIIDGADMHFYLDGKLLGTYPLRTVQESVGLLQFSCNSYKGEMLTSYIDDVRIYTEK